MSKTTNKYSPEVRERAVRPVLDNQGQHESRWSANHRSILFWPIGNIRSSESALGRQTHKNRLSGSGSPSRTVQFRVLFFSNANAFFFPQGNT